MSEHKFEIVEIDGKIGEIPPRKKRPYPTDGVCELCLGRLSESESLDYHHWDDNDLMKGLWLCRTCHINADWLDHGSIKQRQWIKKAEEEQYIKRYFKLKSPDTQRGRQGMKPSREKGRFWIRTKGQLTEAEKKQRKFNPDEVIKFLKRKGYEDPSFWVDAKQRMVLIDRKTGKPLEMNESLIDEIAEKMGLLSGKWLIFIQTEYADELWNKIRKLTNKDKIWSAKISTLVHPLASRGEHVVCVYTKNYLDKQDVMKVRENLREIGVKRRLSYKPDIYTVLGIYSDNKESSSLKKVTRYTS